MNIFNKLFGITAPTQATTQTAVAEPPRKRHPKSKPCRKCGLVQPMDAFNRCSTTADGRQWWCRKCQSVVSKARTAKKNRSINKLPKSNFDKPTLQLNVPDVPQAQYRQLVEIAKARKISMEKLYRQMVNDFLTLNSK
jgi:hypothetical protein